jgi:hypothetical protein
MLTHAYTCTLDCDGGALKTGRSASIIRPSDCRHRNDLKSTNEATSLLSALCILLDSMWNVYCRICQLTLNHASSTSAEKSSEAVKTGLESSLKLPLLHTSENSSRPLEQPVSEIPMLRTSTSSSNHGFMLLRDSLDLPCHQAAAQQAWTM